MEQIFVVVALIHEHHIHAKLLKGDDIILAVVGLQFFQAGFQLALGSLQLFDSEQLRAAGFQFLDSLCDIHDLILQQPFRADRDFLKLAVPNDDSIIVAGGDAGAEFFSLPGLKVLLGGDEDIGGGIEAEKLGSGLPGQVVRNHENGLVAQAQPLALHGGGDHFKGLARAHLMGQESIASVKDVSNGIDLMGLQFDLRVDAGEHNMAPVIFAGPDAVHFLIVLLHQGLPPFGVLPNPVLEGFTEGLLLLRGQGGLLGVENAPLPPIRVLYRVINADIPEIQRILQDAVGVGAAGSVGGV